MGWGVVWSCQPKDKPKPGLGTFNGEADDFKQISSTYAFLIGKRWKVYSCFRLINTDF